ncbi:MAG: hypothetical protein QW350_01600 [Candidatus Aenigmatarchaeota archaeon]|nr:hypothetical protein [Candidatus Aenigmarchaeota archaeon]
MSKIVDIEKIDKKLSKEYINFLLEEKKSKSLSTFYEKLCNLAEKIKIKPSSKMAEKLNKDIAFSNINATSVGVFSASILVSFTFLIFSLLSLYILKDTGIALLFLSLSGFSFFYILTYPSFNAKVTKIQTGDEAIKIILYMVIYLKLNPNFEGSLVYASSHVKGPLSNDIKKAIWDTQTGKYKTIEEALSVYMSKWVVWNEDFVRSINLLYGVLIEPTEEGRENILRKALDFMLNNTREKMKVYVEDITGSINILHILGILLPVMSLIMLPLVSMFLNNMVNPIFVGVGYLIILPAILYFIMNRILLKRPSAFIVPDIKKHPDVPPKGKFYLKTFNKKIPVSILLVSIVVSFIVMSYGIIHFVNLYFELKEATPDMKESLLKKEASITFENVLSSLSITMGIGFGLYSYFYLNSFQKIKIRNDIKNIESDFQLGLYSLGNYLSEGYPIEKSIEKSIEEYEKLGLSKKPIYEMFTKLIKNIKNTGVTFKRAVFEKNYGIINYYPSVLIEEILNVLCSASEKSSVLLGNVAKTIGNYIENLNTVELKIKELLEDVRSGIKMQASFVVPMVCGIVSALGIFILNMMVVISCELQKIEKSFGFNIFEGSESILTSMVGSFSKMMPMTVLQIIIGTYTLETIIIMSVLLNGIENGFDKISRDYIISSNMIRALLVYFVVFVVSIFLFNTILSSFDSSTMFKCKLI